MLAGCTDSRTAAFDPLATYDDGSCPPVLYGCMETGATNYRPLATIEGTAAEGTACLYQGK